MSELVKNEKLIKLIKKEFNVDVIVKTDGYKTVIEGKVKEYDTVYAIGKFLHKKKVEHIVNHLEFEGQENKLIHQFHFEDKTLDGEHVDVLVIGGGVVGCATLRELSKYNLNVLLVEKEEDVAMAQSSHNDGCIHIGFDLKKKSNKLKYLLKAREMLPNLLDELGVDYTLKGQSVAFKSNFFRFAYPFLKMKANSNQVPGGIKFMNKKKLHEVEPNISDEIKCGILFPGGGSFSPYLFTIALAEVALQNNARISLKTIVKSMDVDGDKIKAVHTNRGTIYPKVVINTAGVFSDEIARMANDETFTIHPRKGNDILFDYNATKDLSKTAITIFDLKGSLKKHSKGGGVIPTIDGNILVGPDAIEVSDKEDYSVDRSSVDSILAKHKSTMPKLNKGSVIAYFAGTRAATYEEDFEVRKGIYTKNIVEGVGIQSPGITAAPAIALDLCKFAIELLGIDVKEKDDFKAKRAKPIEVRKLSFDERDKIIKSNPKYGHIICRCEEISEGEILDAINSSLHPTTPDAIKRRVRAGMGRCQGGFCQMHIIKMIAEQNNMSMNDVNKKGEGKIVLKDLKERNHE